VCISAGIISNGKQEFIQCTTEWLMTVSTVLVRETTKKKGHRRLYETHGN